MRECEFVNGLLAQWLCVGLPVVWHNREGEVLSRHPLDEGRYSFTDVAIDRQRGGRWILELDHPDLPRSKRQLWRISPSDAPRAVHEFPEPILPRTLACVDGAPRLATMTNNSESIRSERQWELQRFNVAGKPLTALPLPARDITVGLTTVSLWAIMENQLCQIDSEGNKLVTISLPVDLASMQIAAF